MLSYDRAIEIVSSFIADQPFKDRRAEIEWLLKKGYRNTSEIIEEWDLENRELWKIKEYLDEKNTD